MAKFNPEYWTKVLKVCYSDSQLMTLLQLHFQDIYLEMTTGMLKSQKINLLIEHCQQEPVVAEKLIQVVKVCGAVGPPLDEPGIEIPYTSLTDLLNSCCPPIYGSSLLGSAFFITPGRLLTCAHVVEAYIDNPASLSLRWQSLIYPIVAILEYFPKPYPDLALLQVDIPDHPCVLLGMQANPQDELYSFGHTEKYPQGDAGAFILEGKRIEDGSQTWLKFKAGQVIPGFSGAPLLNMVTGEVCGMVAESRDMFSAQGGHALPLEVIHKSLPKLHDQNQAFHVTNMIWATLQYKHLNGR